MKILTVDDSRSIREILRRALSAAGFEVRQAEDGVDALEVLSDFTPELVITDLNMPRMDGIELVQALRARDETRFVPILILTTEGSPEVRRRGREAGASGWIVKPFDVPRLLETIERVAS